MSNEQNWPATNNRAALNKYDALVLKVAASEWVLTESDEYGPRPTHPCLFGCNHPSHGAPNALAEVRALCEDQIANDAYDHYRDKRALVDRILAILDGKAGR